MRKFFESSHFVLQTLIKKRYLLWEMSRLDLRDRYVGNTFGIFWTLFVPIFTVFVYLFVFVLIFNAKMPTIADSFHGGWGNSYAMYLLSGLLPWMSFQEIMSRSSTIITSNVSLVKQVLFPLEILPMQIFLACLITSGIGFLAFFLYGICFFGLPSALICFFPMIFLFELIAAAGCALLFSSVGVFFRDMKDIVGILCFILIYAMPIFYLPSMVPQNLSFILWLNPLSHMLTMYHDALFFGHITSWFSWIFFPLFALVLWGVGCRVFEGLKPLFGNVL